MYTLDMVAARVARLQEIMKVYLMAVGGITTQLGGVACSLLDVLVDMCERDYLTACRQIDNISIVTVKSIYTSVIKRLEEMNDPGAATHKQALSRVDSEVELLPHLLFLKSIIVDFSIGTKADYTAMTQKLQELINGLKS